MGEIEASPAGAERTRWRLCLAAVVVAGMAVAACSDDDSGSGDSAPGLIDGDESEATSEDSASTVAPVVGDHWHAAYGLYVCDAFVDVTENFDSPLGIHSHGDELVHVHPFSRQGAGENATLVAFAQGAPLLDLTEDQVSVGDETYNGGVDTCNGEVVEIALYKWEDGQEEAEVITEDFEDVAFEADRQAYTIAVVPPGAEVPKPASVATLDQVSGEAPDPSEPEPVELDDLPEGLTQEELEDIFDGATEPESE